MQLALSFIPISKDILILLEGLMLRWSYLPNQISSSWIQMMFVKICLGFETLPTVWTRPTHKKRKGFNTWTLHGRQCLLKYLKGIKRKSSLKSLGHVEGKTTTTTTKTNKKCFRGRYYTILHLQN